MYHDDGWQDYLKQLLYVVFCTRAGSSYVNLGHLLFTVRENKPETVVYDDMRTWKALY